MDKVDAIFGDLDNQIPKPNTLAEFESGEATEGAILLYPEESSAAIKNFCGAFTPILDLNIEKSPR